MLVAGIRERALDITTHCGPDGTAELNEGREPVGGRDGDRTLTRRRARKQ